jgi:AcrR family transcriptional regulator/DNA-binding MarR family transcriptional regulator
MASRRPRKPAGSGARGDSPPASSRGGAAEAFGRERIVEIQRARILGAAVQVACERGASDVTVAHVVQRCGVSRRTFYEVFSDREDCLSAALDDAASQIAAPVVAAFQSKGRWHERIRAGLVELLAFCESEPALARFVLVESLSAGPQALARRDELSQALVAAVDEGRREASKSMKPTALTAEGIVGGVIAVLAARVSDEHPDLLGLTGGLMGMVVLPYLGTAAAAREAARPAPKRIASATVQRDGVSSLEELDMRLTYRTVRVLIAIAEHPAASNRLIGSTAGIVDQGQISKLLARLKRVGLIDKTGIETGKGAPNAWALTERGRRLIDGIRAHTEGGDEESHEQGELR